MRMMIEKNVELKNIKLVIENGKMSIFCRTTMRCVEVQRKPPERKERRRFSFALQNFQ